MPKNLLFISGSNLTVNPRLLKELKLAVSLGYNVDFIGFNSGNWSDKIDAELIKNIDADFFYIPITRKPFLKWFLSAITEKISQKLFPVFKKSLQINAYAHSKRSILLHYVLKRNKKNYTLIIAHTLSTLYPTYKFAKQTNTKFTFDIEDYHPGENTGKDAVNEKARRIFLMKTILPKASYITYASPLIGEHSLNLLDNYPENHHRLINNCFSKDEFKFKENTSEKIKFVWFSQNIAAGRGLELILPAMVKFKDKIDITLIGNLYQKFFDRFLFQYSDFLKIENPLSQKKLNLNLSEFDIGLALEPGKDLNNNIAVSNKIWAYFQSGLFILATDTPAQIEFIKNHKNSGTISKQDLKNFENSIAAILNNIEEIRIKKQSRFEYAQTFAWENESRKLKEIWSRLL